MPLSLPPAVWHISLSALRFFPTRPEKMQQFSSYHSQNLKVQSSGALTKADSVRELKSQTVGESRLQTRTSSYRGDRSTPRMKSSEPVKENSMEPMTVQENFMEPMTIRVSLSPEDSPVGLKKLVEEVNTTNRLQPSPSLETELADFSHSSPKFLNTKLSHTFEINNNVHDRIEAATCKERKTETELFPAHSRMYSGHGETEPFHHDRMAEIASGLHGVFTGVKVAPTDPSDLHTEINGAHHQQIQPHGESKEALSPLLVLPPGRDGAGGKLTDDKGSTCSSLNSSDSNYEMLERQIQQQDGTRDILRFSCALPKLFRT
ncbi:uncharacterized protein LOC112566494 isoform X2 [Pomacea canaliculata]|uniref:uncharacterized protein LOC112566494 isoform X2 n=1 Tax=Pomacea canaliculata TaxID=400727 RepID=UPI000D729114|nr:uncharacterized protein LOC112566494 isoform X2 [Pomacea canaliculata]